MRPMMQDEELIGSERQLRVGPSVVAGELDLEGTVEKLYDGPDLSPQ